MTEPPGLLKRVPDEILARVCSHLRKSELKVLRQVCQSLCNLVTPSIFDRIVLSSSMLDRQAFDGVVHHPILSLSVRELVYDVQVFDKPSRGWLSPLLSQLRSHSYDSMRQNHQLLGQEASCLLQYADMIQLRRSKSAVIQQKSFERELSLIDFEVKFKRLVSEGRRAYMREYEAREHNRAQIESRDWFEEKIDKLQNIRALKLQISWDLDYGDDPLNPRYSSNGTFARSWHPLYLRPILDRGTGALNPPWETPKLLKVFWMKVFWNNHHSVRRLEFDRGSRIMLENLITTLPTGASSDRTLEPNVKLQLSRRFFANLHHLTLDLEVWHKDFPGEHEIALQLLKESLQGAQCLRSLDLGICWRGFPSPESTTEALYELLCDLVFPQLTSLILRDMSIAERNMLAFLRLQPRLRDLQLHRASFPLGAAGQSFRSSILTGLKLENLLYARPSGEEI
ncbi:MAG: hypothetical protein LQ342_007100 [Letrouitia transgressa]|nr:MAG: hypothetical protein LQ342_007100 [Letrouitia transgressa]